MPFHHQLTASHDTQFKIILSQPNPVGICSLNSTCLSDLSLLTDDIMWNEVSFQAILYSGPKEKQEGENTYGLLCYQGKIS